MGTKTKKPPHGNERPRMDDGEAFIPDVARSHARLIDDDAEAFAEEFMMTATSAEDIGENARNEIVSDELAAFSILVGDEEEIPELFV